MFPTLATLENSTFSKRNRTSSEAPGQKLAQGEAKNENVDQGSPERTKQEGTKKWGKRQITEGEDIRPLSQDLAQKHEKQNLAQLADGRKLSLTSGRPHQAASKSVWVVRQQQSWFELSETSDHRASSDFR